MFKIEQGKPIPPDSSPGERFQRRKYPWREMKPGDSIFIPCKNGDRRLHAWRVKSSANAARVKITQRYCAKGIRVWRIE